MLTQYPNIDNTMQLRWEENKLTVKVPLIPVSFATGERGEMYDMRFVLEDSVFAMKERFAMLLLLLLGARLSPVEDEERAN